MVKRMMVHVVAAAALLTLAAGPAQATNGPAFNINFYNDANHSIRVGFARAACNPDPIATLQWGVSTQYQEVIFIGQCIDGVLYYDIG